MKRASTDAAAAPGKTPKLALPAIKAHAGDVSAGSALSSFGSLSWVAAGGQLTHPIDAGGKVRLYSTGCKEKITQKPSAKDRFKGKKTVSTTFAGFVTTDISAAALDNIKPSGTACNVSGCAGRLFKPADKEILMDVLRLDSALEHSDALDLGYSAGDETFEAEDLLKLQVCTHGHVCGSAKVKMAMIGHLGWGISMRDSGFGGFPGFF